MNALRILVSVLCYLAAIVGIPWLIWAGIVPVNQLTGVLLAGAFFVLVILGACVAPSDPPGSGGDNRTY